MVAADRSSTVVVGFQEQCLLWSASLHSFEECRREQGYEPWRGLSSRQEAWRSSPRLEAGGLAAAGGRQVLIRSGQHSWAENWVHGWDSGCCSGLAALGVPNARLGSGSWADGGRWRTGSEPGLGPNGGVSLLVSFFSLLPLRLIAPLLLSLLLFSARPASSRLV